MTFSRGFGKIMDKFFFSSEFFIEKNWTDSRADAVVIGLSRKQSHFPYEVTYAQL